VFDEKILRERKDKKDGFWIYSGTKGASGNREAIHE
jgi:hypothetical protein